MMFFRCRRIVVVFLIGLLALGGCQTLADRGNDLTRTAVADEPEWIRNGEPILYEGRLWYPQDEVDILLENEVMFLGRYKETPFFAAKVDVKPLNKIYTRFGRHQFRIFLPDEDSR